MIQQGCWWEEAMEQPPHLVSQLREGGREEPADHWSDGMSSVDIFLELVEMGPREEEGMGWRLQQS